MHAQLVEYKMLRARPSPLKDYVRRRLIVKLNPTATATCACTATESPADADPTATGTGSTEVCADADPTAESPTQVGKFSWYESL